MRETQVLRLGLFVVLAFVISYLIAFFVWGWLKVKAASQTSVPEQPQLKATPQGLEHETARLIQASTGKTARVRTGVDKGLIDVEILDDAGQVKGIVQCVPLTMAYSFTPAHVRDFYELKRKQGAKAAYIVTMGRFEYAVELEAKRLKIKLLDGASLQRISQRVNQIPLALPPEDLFEDHARWQRPGLATFAPSLTPAANPPRHVVVPRMTPVMIPVETRESEASYKPSVRQIRPEEKTAWPVVANHKRHVPTALIKPIPTETLASETPERAEPSEFYRVQQQLQARKYKPTRTTVPENPRY